MDIRTSNGSGRGESGSRQVRAGALDRSTAACWPRRSTAECGQTPSPQPDAIGSSSTRHPGRLTATPTWTTRWTTPARRHLRHHPPVAHRAFPAASARSGRRTACARGRSAGAQAGHRHLHALRAPAVPHVRRVRRVPARAHRRGRPRRSCLDPCSRPCRRAPSRVRRQGWRWPARFMT